MKTVVIRVPDWVDERALQTNIKETIEKKKDTLIEYIDSYKKAKEYLGLQVTDEGYNPDNTKALRALDKLMTIASVWNLIDKFAPNSNDIKQHKWFTWFEYDNFTKRYICCGTDASGVLAGGIYFKTRERAEQFGNQFIELWNEYLLNR